MSRIIAFSLLFFLVTACTPKTSNLLADGSPEILEKTEPTPPERGQYLIDRINQLPGTTISNSGPRSSVKVSRNDGVYNDSVSPTFVLNGEVYNGDFSQVYREVVAGTGEIRVKRLNKAYEVAQYGLVGGRIVIAIDTSK